MLYKALRDLSLTSVLPLQLPPHNAHKEDRGDTVRLFADNGVLCE